MKNRILFPKKKDLGKRNWGKEELLVLIPKVLTLKKLFIKKGRAGGLQYHRKKDEVAILIKGQMLIRWDDGSDELIEKIINPGDVVHFPPGAIHQEEALEDCEIIEASTNHFNDRVRCEPLFGIEDYDGLPTTEEDEIVEK